MKVLYISHLVEQSGWGKASRDILTAMDYAGINVVPRVVLAGGKTVELTQRQFDLINQSSKDCDVVIQHVLPHLYEYSGYFKKNIGMYYSETGQLHHTSYYSYLNMMDELWVPSDIMIEQAQESEVHTPMYKIPHPFNTDINPANYQKLPIAEVHNEFSFYYIGEATRRKNLSALIRAFHTEFSFNEPVQLVIKANRAGMPIEQCVQLVNEFAQAAKEHIKLYYNINTYKPEIIISKDMDDNEIYSLHKTCDCLVIPSCGEAINLPAMDAILFGNKVVGTDKTGINEFVNHLDNGYLVESQLQSCYGMTEGFQDMYTSRETCYSINEIDLRRGMRWAYENSKKHNVTPTPTLLDIGIKIKDRLNESIK